MKKTTISTLGALLIGLSSSAFAGLDSQSLTNSLNNTNSSAAGNSGFAIVYGGQDISRGSISLHDAKVYQPVLIG